MRQSGPWLFQDIVKNQGFQSLWRGNSAAVLKIFITNCLKITVYEYLKHITLHKGEDKYTGVD